MDVKKEVSTEWIQHLTKQMIVGNPNDQFNGAECRLVVEYLIKQAEQSEPSATSQQRCN